MITPVLAILSLLVAPSPVNAPPSDRSALLRRYFAALAAVGRLNGVVYVAEGDSVLYRDAFGPADFGTGRPNRIDSPFPIASVTKTITAAAILQLHEQGRLGLDDPVVAHLPGFPYPTITIRNLLSHTSGLAPYDVSFEPVRKAHPDTVFTNADVVAQLARVKPPLEFAPGTGWRYDNLNFILLARVVERVSGVSYQRYVTEHLLDPAGLRDTHWSPVYSGMDDSALSIPHLHPHLYSDLVDRPDTIPFVAEYWHAYRFQGFGELISTARDLARYAAAVWDGPLLSEESRAAARTPVALRTGDPNPGSYGLGWYGAVDDSLGPVVWHGGGQIGLRLVLMRELPERRTVIVMDNTQNEVERAARDALRILAGLPVARPEPSTARIYGKVLVSKGVAAARAKLAELTRKPRRYDVDEGELNTLGYDLLGQDRTAAALEVFAANTRLFPTSWNGWDSYGEALEKAGRRDQARAMYRRSLELNPESASGKAALERLGPP
jgi:CubicO group peptidase (beta-lactamase class C family)